MIALETFAAHALEAWIAAGHAPEEPVTVAELMEGVFTYPQARRSLGIDVSEDYESLVLRLLAEEGGLAATHPVEAAELAQATLLERLPDLSVLHQLRQASLVMARRLLEPGPEPLLPASLGGDTRASEPTRAQGARGADRPEGSEAVAPVVAADLPVVEVAVPRAAVGRVPERERVVMRACWSCGQLLPTERQVNFCPQCGADQRPPTCANCHEPMERDWKFCPECGWQAGTVSRA